MRILMAAALMTAAFGSSGAWAQDRALETRVDRIEREMRAVQRKVFPGGAGQTIEPQITAEVDTVVPGSPSGSPLVDLTQRVGAIESQISTMTGEVEQGQFRLRQLEEAFNAYKNSAEARIKALEANTATAPREPLVTEVDVAAPPPNPRPAEAAAGPKAGGTRAQQVAAIEKPASGDPAEDGYTYGYRLWSAKFYPEARRELEAVATKYPKHRRASFSQNLLGRAYLDAGAPSLAAVAFYENYKKNPNGERAAESLYYLAQALVKLKKPASEVCKVYGELTQLYGDRLSAEMKAGVARGRAAQKCT